MRSPIGIAVAPALRRLVKWSLPALVGMILACGAASAQTLQTVSDTGTVTMTGPGWVTVQEAPGGLGFVTGVFIPDADGTTGHTGQFMFAGENGEIYGFYDVASSTPNESGSQHTTLTLSVYGGNGRFQAAGGDGTMVGDVDALGQGTFTLDLTVILRDEDLGGESEES